MAAKSSPAITALPVAMKKTEINFMGLGYIACRLNECRARVSVLTALTSSDAPCSLQLVSVGDGSRLKSVASNFLCRLLVCKEAIKIRHQLKVGCMPK